MRSFEEIMISRAFSRQHIQTEIFSQLPAWVQDTDTPHLPASVCEGSAG